LRIFCVALGHIYSYLRSTCCNCECRQFDTVGWAAGRASGPKNMGGWWSWWALVSSDGVASSRMVSVSASVNLPLHHKVQTFSSGTGSPGWSRKKGRKMVVYVWCKTGLFSVKDARYFTKKPSDRFKVEIDQRLA